MKGLLVNMESMLSVVIPRDRIGVLLGHNGEIKKRIERAQKVKIKVDSESGNVEIVNKLENNDPTRLLCARDITMAIGRGFSPEKAFTIQDEDAVLEILNLRETFGRNENDIKRIKGRVIGREGKIRRMLEEFSNASISIYGHTISIIGNYETHSIAREAILMLLKGKQHSTVYKYLIRKRREMKKREKTELWDKSLEQIR